jgi:hypothetical protein
VNPTIIHGHLEGDPLAVPYQRAIRIKCLCDGCNRGWLKDVVDASVPFVAAMTQDIAITLDTSQQWTLAIWAMSRAMVWEFCSDSNRPIFYTDSERASLRTNSRIPENTSVWLARYVGDANLGAWVSDYTKPIRSHVTTLVYRHLAVQILTVRLNLSIQPGAVLNPKTGPWPWPSGTVRIYPSTRIAHWPPLNSISDEHLTRFFERWDGHQPGEMVLL